MRSERERKWKGAQSNVQQQDPGLGLGRALICALTASADMISDVTDPTVNRKKDVPMTTEKDA